MLLTSNLLFCSFFLLKPHNYIIKYPVSEDTYQKVPINFHYISQHNIQLTWSCLINEAYKTDVFPTDSQTLEQLNWQPITAASTGTEMLP